MPIEIPKVAYSGKIKKITIGQGPNSITLGGETSYPFHLFEGEVPNPPKIAMQVLDTEPEGWPENLRDIFRDVLKDPAAWAKKCIDEYSADAICLRLLSTDPNGLNKSPDEAAPAVKKVLDAIDVPLIVWGAENNDKDAEVLPKIAEVCQAKKIVLGPVTDKNYKKIGASAIAYGHTVVASTPIDINLAKQLNILLTDLGVPESQIINDLNIGGCTVGYGLEYTYSVMERQRQAGLAQEDDKLQFPIICNFALDVWKKKEVRIEEKDDPKMGDIKKRGVMIEAVTGWVQILAGANLLVMQHPEAVQLVRNAVKSLLSEN